MSLTYGKQIKLKVSNLPEITVKWSNNYTFKSNILLMLHSSLTTFLCHPRDKRMIVSNTT